MGYRSADAARLSVAARCAARPPPPVMLRSSGPSSGASRCGPLPAPTGLTYEGVRYIVRRAP